MQNFYHKVRLMSISILCWDPYLFDSKLRYIALVVHIMSFVCFLCL